MQASLKGFYQWPYIAAALGNAFLFIVSIWLVSLSIFSIFIIIKYLPYLLKDMERINRNGVPSPALVLFCVTLLLLPAFFNLGPLWFVLFWLALFWLYQNRGERIVTVSLLIVFAVSPNLAGFASKFITYSTTNANRDIFLIENNMDSKADIDGLVSWFQLHPDDAVAANTLAVYYISANRYNEASALIDKGLRSKPYMASLYNSRGILALKTGNTKEAVKVFQKALELQPGNINYYYNLSKSYLELGLLVESDNAIEKAIEIDPGGVVGIISRDKDRKKSMPVMDKTDIKTYFKRQFSDSSEAKECAAQIWNFFFGLSSQKQAPLAAAVLLVILVLTGVVLDRKKSLRCTSCGRFFQSMAKPAFGITTCQYCSWSRPKLQMFSERLHQKTITDKRAWTRRLGLMEYFLPGLGLLHRGKTAGSFIRVLFLSTGLVLLITGLRFIYSFVPAAIEIAIYAKAIGLAIIVLLYLVSYRTVTPSGGDF